ncbi:polyhydroxyalkanoate synthesis repressor PhaR [Emcibacter nanhaiensis]|uniref:Polyhydroxyalkanoate synthesis repressor PhaR n=1 Tax=Emcibacter nanhaiensis TaxID=1505037 RepID=A0A501PNE1_9PROT|nr:polyhydroxyalkanoate synthesis repressor PhaR [Emcibacter nanhaiensis]TPD61678.1 polyhydroxyalkanoate synthesis repressor PhaR [Emcibacter nanhaiensis]
MAKKDKTENGQIVIKKYANRRLYNTDSSSYVTLDDLATMVRDGKDFIVRDAKSGEDITHSVLTQIIFEEESKGETLLPINFLRQLISFYGGGLQQVVPDYLESSMSMFAENQERFRQFVEENFSSGTPFSFKSFKPFEEMTRQNMAAFENAMQMFSPFHGIPQPETKEKEKAEEGAKGDEQLSKLQEQLAAMQQQLQELQKK